MGLSHGTLFQAYTLAGRNFSMTSPDDICQVLYRELRLPQNGSKPSSAKDVLQKLTHLHELPQVILEWRKLNASVTKVVFPMSRAAHEHKGIKSEKKKQRDTFKN